MTIQYLTRGNKKGVFLSIRQWKSVEKQLSKLNKIEKRREEILSNYKKAKKEIHTFTSDVGKLKASLR